MIAALMWKEWREQRWRCVLGTLVLTTISAGLVRAQLMTLAEALTLTFGFLGLLLAIFLAMGSVATERADGTWAFYTARPIRRATILRVKWLVGAVYLTFALLFAGAAAHAAAASRRLFDVAALPAELQGLYPTLIPAGNSAAWLWTVVGLALVSFLALYTVLFFVLTRARDELHAGLGGVLLTMVCLAWLIQYKFAHTSTIELDMTNGWDPQNMIIFETIPTVLWYSSLLNPLSPLVFIFEPPGNRVLAVVVVSVLWIFGPLWLAGRLERRGAFA
jgi:hypothetical protein